MNEHKSSGGINLGRIFFGLFLVLIGLYFLAKNFGWIAFDINLWQFWPLVIILIGLSMMSIRTWIGGLIAALVVISIFLVIFYGVAYPQESTQETINFTRAQQAERAKLNLKMGAGDLKITGGGDKLLTGDFESNFLNLEQTSSTKDSLQTINLSTVGSFAVWGGKTNTMNLILGSELPYEFDFDTGAIDMDVDLSKVKAEKTVIDTGASDLDITFGDLASSSSTQINAGASSIKIKVPRSAGVDLKLDSAVSSKSLPNFTDTGSGHYQSTSYETKDKKIMLDLNLGASSLDVNWY